MKKILFIEDEPALQKAIGRFLEEKGYQFNSALDGEVGLTAARENNPDLILLDLILPKKDGFEVLKELKKDESTKHIPVIVLTNLEGSADIGEIFSYGAAAYLVKANYDLEEVVKKIEETLK
jgi:DNA-binding response OmpR family regulator